MYYVGTSFNPADGGYKTIQNAKKAAKKIEGKVYDETGAVVYPESEAAMTTAETTATATGTTETATETAQTDNLPTDAENAENGAQDAAETATIELTDSVPADALEPNADGSVNTYNEKGEKVGTATAAEATAAAERAAKAITPVSGTVEVVRAGMIAIRNAASWESGHKCGIAKKGHKARVTEKINLTGGALYRMENGNFISGKEGDTVFTAD